MTFVKAISLFLAVLLSFIATVFFAFSVIDENTQEEYCHVIGHAHTAPPLDGKAFIKTKSGRFIAYDAKTHTDAKLFYVRQTETPYDFNVANWQSVNGLCKLKKESYLLIAVTFLIAFPVSFVFVFVPLLLGYSLLRRKEAP